MESALEASQDTAYTSHQPASSEPDLTTTAFTSSAPDDSIERPKSPLANESVGSEPIVDAFFFKF